MSVLLSGFLGALLVFVLGAFREWWRNEQERRGLLRLLLAEIEHNDEVFRTVAERLRKNFAYEDLIGDSDLFTLRTRTWINVQGRAAALLTDDLMAELDGYYSPLEMLLTLAGFTDMVNDSFARTLRAELQETNPALPLEEATRNPYHEQLDKLLAAQERVPKAIRAYLARPWWGSLLVLVDRWGWGGRSR